MQRRSSLERTIARHEKFAGEISDAAVLFEFAESDEASVNELRELLSRALVPHGPYKRPIFRGATDPEYQRVAAWV